MEWGCEHGRQLLHCLNPKLKHMTSMILTLCQYFIPIWSVSQKWDSEIPFSYIFYFMFAKNNKIHTSCAFSGKPEFISGVRFLGCWEVGIPW